MIRTKQSQEKEKRGGGGMRRVLRVTGPISITTPRHQQDLPLATRVVFQVLKMMVTDGISDAQLSFIVDQTIKEADGDGDGKISFDEFAQILAKTDIDSRMTIRF
eukprot:TRINITY_DN8829_c0_g1_i1.p2 TRINITY_DN8829_c0_g1~~TRINITY_DN8829_c0_g1_i1.p2  ORF type:complete len:105 (+),score=10.11 TRINITY_DN8829_c0_g1_i1:563-877(+)